MGGTPGGAGAAVIRTASFSRDRQYRYRLRRQWDEGACVAWVMLNPSTADSTVDDPTLRRCIAFSRRWGYGALLVVNLFAFRASDPRALIGAADPVGPGADRALRDALREADAVIAAWGNGALADGAQRHRVRRVRQLLPTDALCLGLTGRGEPRHPLYVPADRLPSHLSGSGPSPASRLSLIVGGRQPTMAA